ncbi:MAG: FecR domain-containing protein [Bacteroidota bacterium]
MTEQELKELVNKYLNGTISREEERLLEQFDENLLHKNSANVFLNERHRSGIHQNLSSRISSRRKKSTGRIYRLAASLAILIGLSIGGRYLFFETGTGEPVDRTVVTTEWGQKNKLTLPDGTTVRLNSGSTLTFPETFHEFENREVTLSGEGFFEVTHNPNKPFVIRTGNVTTKVLGTSFNVNAYPENEEVSVTVATGKVQVISNRDGATDKEVLVMPNAQALFNKTKGTLDVSQVAIDRYLNWKDGILRFDDVTLAEAVKLLRRWYGVEFVFGKEELASCHITAISDNEPLAVFLESMKHVKKELNYEYVEDNKILINGNCGD